MPRVSLGGGCGGKDAAAEAASRCPQQHTMAAQDQRHPGIRIRAGENRAEQRLACCWPRAVAAAGVVQRQQPWWGRRASCCCLLGMAGRWAVAAWLLHAGSRLRWTSCNQAASRQQRVAGCLCLRAAAPAAGSPGVCSESATGVSVSGAEHGRRFRAAAAGRRARVRLRSSSWASARRLPSVLPSCAARRAPI
jgi:hypothetical protein